MAELALDLGTWSVAAELVDGRGRRLIPDPVSGQTWFRAAVALAPDGSWLVGRGAEELRTTHPDRYRDDLKRLLHHDAPVYLNGVPYAVPDLLSVIVARVLRQASQLTTESIEIIRLGVPAAFEGGRRASLQTAVARAGFTGEVDLVLEPVAAARTALGDEPTEGTWLIFDLGGGTLDLALIRADSGGELVVVDAGGSDQVGGFAIDDAIVRQLRAQCAIPAHVALPPADLADLTTTARSLKQQLSDATTGYARNPLRQGPRQFTLTGGELAALVGPVLDTACGHAEALLAANGLGWTALAGVVPTGGATRSPAVLHGLRRRTTVVTAAEPPELATVHGLVPVDKSDPDEARRAIELILGLAEEAEEEEARETPSGRSAHSWLDSRGRAEITALTARDVDCTATNYDHGDTVTAVVFSPDGRFLASGDEDNEIRVWDRATGATMTLTGHEDWVQALAFDPESELLASASDDETIRCWSPVTGSHGSVTLAGHTDEVLAVAYSPQGLLASGGADHTLRVWSGRNGDALGAMPMNSTVNSLAFSPGGTRLLVATDASVVMFTVPDLDIDGEVDESGEAVAFSPNGTLFAVGNDDGAVRIADTESGDVLTLFHRKNDVSCVAFNPRGDVLAVGSSAGSNVHLYRVSDGFRLAKLDHDGEYVNDLAFSPDGTLLVTGTDENGLFVWQVD